ncbi:MAG: TolC family protein [Bryobacterales bacterium]|nr:TolC family protein [Bryobacterales bacterium]
MPFFAVVLSLILTASSWVCHAQTQATTTLEQLIAEALERNPEIQAAMHRYQALRSKASQEAALPEPTLSIGYTSVGRPYPFAGLGHQPMANAGVMYTQEFPAPGKRRLRAAGALEQARAGLRALEQVRLEVVSRLKQAYYRLAYSVHAEENLRERAELLEAFLKVAEARYAAGLASQQDVLRAQLELANLGAERDRLTGQAKLLEAQIRRLLARPAHTPLGRPAKLVSPGELPPLAQFLEAAAQGSPALAERESRIAGAEIALNLARRDAWPDLALSGGYFSMGAMGSMYMVRLDLKLPLFYARKQRAAVAGFLDQLEAQRRELESAALDLRYRIEEEYTAASVAARLARLYATTLVPQAQLALEASLASYQSGAGDLAGVLSDFEKLLRYELGRLEEIANYHTSVSRLEELTGKAVLP